MTNKFITYKIKKYQRSGKITVPGNEIPGPTIYNSRNAGPILNYLQPTDKKLPVGQKIPLRDTSTELSMSIGGENGELAYLIPTFKYGLPLKDPIKEFLNSKDVLGGPFKTWQEADEFAKLRHHYVEKRQDIPSPIRWWGKEFKQGGEIPDKDPFVNYKTTLKHSIKDM